MKKLFLLLIFSLLASSFCWAATYTVTNCNDSGAGSLRQAIADAGGAGDNIVFNITTAAAGYSTGEGYSGLVTNETAGAAWFRIVLGSQLNVGTSNLVIDGQSQPVTEANNPYGPAVEVRGRATNEVFDVTVSSVTIEGLVINRFSGTNSTWSSAVKLNAGANNCHIYGCYIGPTASGEGLAPLGHYYGVYINGGRNNLIGGTSVAERNIISGNDWEGVYIYGTGSDSNEVLGNYIGTTASGEGALRNFDSGVYIDGGAKYNQIGNGVTSAARNIISGNGNVSICICNAGTNSNEVLGNYIGTDASGGTALSRWDGVDIFGGAQYNLVGNGLSTAARNIISGNGNDGVWISGSGTNSNEVLGNYLGTTASGAAALANYFGVCIQSGACYNLVGNGVTSAARNVISGNTCDVFISDAGTNSNEVLGNYIGTTASGEAALANSCGVYIGGGAQGNKLTSNVISGNSWFGVQIDGGTNSNEVAGNFIGTDQAGTANLGNTIDGIIIDSACSYDKIGPANLIAYNGYGIDVTGDCNYILITQNSMEGNAAGGISLEAGANNNIPYPVITFRSLQRRPGNRYRNRHFGRGGRALQDRKHAGPVRPG